MCAITIPQLHCPFSSTISPFAAAVARHTDHWVARLGLYTGAAFEKYRSDNFAVLTARCYPNARLERLEIANDLIVLLFALDDLQDYRHERLSLVQQRENLRAFIESAAAIMQGRHTPPSQGQIPLLAALADLWARLEKIGPPAWLACFTESMMALLDTAMWEFGHTRGQLPSLVQYLEKRPFLAGAQVATDMIAVIEDIWLPPAIMQHPTLAEMVQCCRNAICWARDLFSLNKEITQGDEHNLVCILKNERRLSLEEAILCAAAIHNTEVRKFEALSKQPPACDADTGPALERYVQALTHIMKGNVDWSGQDSQRYRFTYKMLNTER